MKNSTNKEQTCHYNSQITNYKLHITNHKLLTFLEPTICKTPRIRRREERLSFLETTGCLVINLSVFPLLPFFSKATIFFFTFGILFTEISYNLQSGNHISTEDNSGQTSFSFMGCMHIFSRHLMYVGIACFWEAGGRKHFLVVILLSFRGSRH